MLAHLRTRTLASVAAADERLASLEDQCLDLLAAYAEHGRDLGVGLISQLEQGQRRTLIRRQALHVGEQLAQLLASLYLHHGCVPAAEFIEHALAADRFSPGTQLRDAAIARDRIQPRPQRDLPLAAAPQRPIRSHERELQRVLRRVPVAEQMQAERQHSGGVAIVDRLEREAVSSSHPRNQLLVALNTPSSTLEHAAERKSRRNYHHERSMHRP